MEPHLQGLEDLVLGSLVAVVGAIALGVAVARRRRAGPLLASFGAFASLYGVRLFFGTPLVGGLGISAEASRWVVSLITYAINVPAWFFFWKLLGPGWRNLIVLWLAVMSAFAVVGVASDLLLRRPGTLTEGPNNVLVIAGLLVALVAIYRGRATLDRDRRVLTVGLAIFGLFALNDNLVSMGVVPWSVRQETVGFVIFLGCLGFIASRRVLAGEQELAALQGEIEAARRIQSSLLPKGLPRPEGLRVAALFRPTSEVAGDLYDLAQPGPRRLAVLVADVSGHGVPAALVAAMVKVGAKAEREAVDRPARLLTGLHEVLAGELARGFVTAVHAFFDAGAGEVVVARAGHPAPLLVRRSGEEVVEAGAVGPVLGRFSAPRYREERVPFEPGDRLVLYTDGLVEARGPDGEMFGEERLRRLLAASARSSGDALCDALLEALRAWVGARDDLVLEDDLTLVVVDHA